MRFPGLFLDWGFFENVFRSVIHPVLALFFTFGEPTVPDDQIVDRDVQFNIAEASGRTVTSVSELERTGIYKDADFAQKWILDNGRGYVRIGFWDAGIPRGAERLAVSRKNFERFTAVLIKHKNLVKKVSHPNGAEGMVAFGDGVKHERCAFGLAVLDLDGYGSFDTLIDTAICSNGPLKPNSVENLIWYLKIEP
ncbi:MAG: hypothetical protein RIG26_04595 [Thalassospira sp.]|uniref:hypothetical protein n=1 Tax=Thalassospira sp. TaxID=1912094 RepID=UPI0032EBE499